MPAEGLGRVHVVDGPKLPNSIPAGFALDPAEVTFDPARHLQIEAPTAVFSSEFERSSFPLPDSVTEGGKYSLGYCEPFRLLSVEGVKELRSIIDKNEVHAKSNERIPKCLRGLGYRSQFVRDLAYNSEVGSMLSAIAGKPLAPHSMPMNLAHTNFGREVKATSEGDEVIIDQWHVDSVDYVIVLILSDLTHTVGGDLQVFHKKGVRDNAAFLKAGIGADEEHLVRTVPYVGAGYCILMQGSQILHRVSPMTSAEEPRVSCVFSYMSLNCARRSIRTLNETVVALDGVQTPLETVEGSGLSAGLHPVV